VAQTVLLVCSEELRAQLTLRMLRNAQVQVDHAKTPQEVADRIRANREIQVVLCDWRLPLANALEWIEGWIQSSAPRTPHFLIISDRLPTQADSASLFEKGVCDVWVRPLPDYLLLPRLKVWLSMSRAGEGGSQAAAALLKNESIDLFEPDKSASAPSSYAIDPKTHLLGRDLFLELLEGFFTGSRRLRLYVGILAISISNYDELTRQLGPDGPDKLRERLTKDLHRLKRQEDLLAAWDANLFLLASYFPNGDSVRDFGRRMLDELQKSALAESPDLGPVRFLVSGAWGPSRDYPMPKDTIEAIIRQFRTEYASR